MIASGVGNLHYFAQVSKKMTNIVTESLPPLILENFEKSLGAENYRRLINRVTTPDQSPYEKVKAIYMDLQERFNKRVAALQDLEFDQPKPYEMIVSPSQYSEISRWMKEIDVLVTSKEQLSWVRSDPMNKDLTAAELQQVTLKFVLGGSSTASYLEILGKLLPEQMHFEPSEIREYLIDGEGRQVNHFRLTGIQKVGEIAMRRVQRFIETHPLSLLECRELRLETQTLPDMEIPKDLLLARNLNTLVIRGD